MPKVVLFVEGVVGVGKSVACAALARRGVSVVTEPVYMWDQHLEGVYGPTPGAWALPMQLLALTTRNELLFRVLDNSAGDVVLVERSPRSDAIFAAQLNAEDAAVYSVAAARYKTLLSSFPDVRFESVYLRALPEVCMGRVKKRARPAERTMTLGSLQGLFELHDTEFADSVVIDASKTAEEVADDLAALVTQLSSSN